MKPSLLLLSVLIALSAFAAESKSIAVPEVVQMRVPQASNSQAIVLQKLDVQVEILPAIAQTQLTMRFYNPNARPLEGELVVPLAEGQTITAMALDINGEMRAAVPVPKAQAQQVFEAVERRQVDPALFEQISGNQFRLRVYPIPAQGSRTVSITINQALSMVNGRMRYQLPLSFGKVASAQVRINSSVATAAGFAVPTGFQQINNSAGGFVAQAQLTQHALRNGVNWEFAAPTSSQVLLQQVGTERYFLANIPVADSAYVRTPPQHLAIVWDASLSRQDADLETQLAVLAAYFKAVPNAQVSVQIVRGTDREDVRDFRIVNGDWSALRQQLIGVVYDGASSLVPMRPVSGADEYWLFSDGIDNLFAMPPADLGGVPLHIFNPQSNANHTRLRALAESHGGVYAPWRDAASAAQVITQLWQEHSHIVSVDGDVSAVVWPSARAQQGFISLLGKVNSGVAAPRLQVQLASKDGRQQLSLPLSGRESSAVAALWASSQIEQWSAYPEQHREDILALGKRFGVVSPQTSLLVLDDVADYVRYDIVPPPSLQAAYQRLLQQQQQQQNASREQQVEQVAQQWQEFGKWWQTDFPKGTPKQTVAADKPNMAVASAPQAMMAESVAVAADAAIAQERSVALRKDPADKANDKQVSIAIQAYQDNSPSIARLRAAAKAAAYPVYVQERAHNLRNPSFYLAASEVLWEKGLTTEAVRVASVLAEMQLENRYLLRLLGQQFMQFKRADLAVDVYTQVLRMAPEEPQSYRDVALTEAQAGQYQAAADHLYAIITREWDGRFGGMQLIAVDELNQLLAAHPKQINIQQYHTALLHNRPVDMRVVLTWDSDNSDMDLWVLDPNGEKVYYAHPQSYHGGRISQDFTGGYGPEVFWLKEPKAGEYEIRAHFYGDRQQIVTGPTTAHVRLIRHWGKPNQSEQILRVKMVQEQAGQANQESVLIGTFTVK